MTVCTEMLAFNSKYSSWSFYQEEESHLSQANETQNQLPRRCNRMYCIPTVTKLANCQGLGLICRENILA